MSHPPYEIVTNGTPCSTSRVANRQLCPNFVSPKGAAKLELSRFVSKASFALGEVMILWACSVNLSRPSTSWFLSSMAWKRWSRSSRSIWRRSTSLTVRLPSSVMPRTLKGMPGVGVFPVARAAYLTPRYPVPPWLFFGIATLCGSSIGPPSSRLTTAP